MATTLLNESKDSKTYLETFIKRHTLEGQTLSREIRSLFYDFKLDGNKDGYLLLKGLDAFFGKESLIEYGSLLGTPYSYIQEGNGQFFHEITPFKTHETEISSKSSKINLDFHTELVFHYVIPDYLLLFCVRGDRDKQAKTYVSSVRNSFPKIPLSLKKVLYEPIFVTGIDHSFGNVDTVRGNGKTVPVLYGDPEDPLMNFDPDLMVAKTVEGEAALQEFRAILYENKISFVLEPGELLVIDNLRAVHGRSSFTPYYDGNDRHLYRIFVTRDLVKAQQFFQKKERTITYEF